MCGIFAKNLLLILTFFPKAKNIFAKLKSEKIDKKTFYKHKFPHFPVQRSPMVSPHYDHA